MGSEWGWDEGGLTVKLDAVAPIQAAGPRYFTPCAQCGDTLFAPEWSEHVNERCVRHFWSCDACGYQFETSVYLAMRD